LCLQLDWDIPHKGLHAFLGAERIPGKDCVSCSCSTWNPTLRNVLYHCLSTKKGTRKTPKIYQEDVFDPALETLGLTTAFDRPIRIIVDPDDLIPWVTVRIRKNPDHLSCLGLSSSLVKANNTAKSSDFSHSCTFFCYLLAFRSSVPPSFFPKRHRLQLKTIKPSQAFSSSTFTNNITQHAS
jgi:hypothetical protein